MEATVASLIAEASGQPASPQADSLTPVSDWFDVPRSAASSSAQTTLLASGVHSFQMGTEHASRIERALESLVLNEVASRSSSATEHRRILHALRADSAGAPSGHKQVVAWGEPWPSTELKEMGDHEGNSTWRHVTKQEIPADRRIHRLLWVYKLKQRRLRKGQALRRRLLNARQRHRLQPNLLRRAEVRVGSQPLRHVGEIAMSARFSLLPTSLILSFTTSPRSPTSRSTSLPPSLSQLSSRLHPARQPRLPSAYPTLPIGLQ
jgi:hypothetical protein